MKAAVAIMGVLMLVLALALLVQTAEVSKVAAKHDETLKELEQTKIELRDARKKIEFLQGSGGAGQPASDGAEPAAK